MSAERLANSLEQVGDGLLCVVTGAGISAASGIPTFRGTDPEAIWSRDVTELGTYRFFCEDPVASWRWYLHRFEGIVGSAPNAGHTALAALERWQLERGGRFVLVTQNIDGLHARAGAKNLIEVHGSASRVRCPRDGCEHGAPSGSISRSEINLQAFLDAPSIETLPRCPVCSDVLRQHVLWFDEYYDGHQDYQWFRVQLAAATAEFVLFVGTSFSVGVTELFLQRAIARGVPCASIDPGARHLTVSGVDQFHDRAEELLPEVCSFLGIETRKL